MSFHNMQILKKIPTYIWGYWGGFLIENSVPGTPWSLHMNILQLLFPSLCEAVQKSKPSLHLTMTFGLLGFILKVNS